MLKNKKIFWQKTRRIIEQLTPAGKAKVHRDKLAAAGFNFNYHTHTYTTKTGNVYMFCYEYGYLLLEDGYVALVKNDRDHV